MKALINGKIIHEHKILEGYTLLFDTHIVSLHQGELPINCELIDTEGLYISAGFIDIHIHGSGGADVMDATAHSLETISQTLLQTGTSSFIATTMTMERGDIISALDTIVEYGDSVTGSKIVGIHLEGPFINPSKCGAQNPDYIQKASLDFVEPYLNHIRMITLAPEMQGAKEFIKTLHRDYPHIVLSIGHSDADYLQSLESFSWGISHATHLFNAMPPWHHREPSIIGAVFDSDVTADIIADLIHTHPHMLGITYKLKKEKMILITDAMRAGCMKCGEYELGGQSVRVAEGRATLESGVLAGSVLKLNEAVLNFINHTESTLIEVIEMVTTRPAKLLGVPLGQLSEGYRADITVFDKNISIKQVYIDGELKYNNKNF